jgi:hypothetical protein
MERTRNPYRIPDVKPLGKRPLVGRGNVKITIRRILKRNVVRMGGGWEWITNSNAGFGI